MTTQSFSAQARALRAVALVRAHRQVVFRALAVAFVLTALLPHSPLGAQDNPTPGERNAIPADHRVAVDIFSCSGQRPALPAPSAVVDGAPPFFSTRSCQESYGVTVRLLAGGIETARTTQPGWLPQWTYVPAGEIEVWQDVPAGYESLGICWVSTEPELQLFYGESFAYSIPSSPTDRPVGIGCNWFNFPSRSITADEARVEVNPPYSEAARAYATAPVSDSYGSDTLADAIAVVNQGDGDQDGDELPDSVEAQFGTDPANADTDGDGSGDWEEIQVYGTDPLDSNDPGLVAFDQDVAYVTIPDRGATTDGAGDYGASDEYYPNDFTAVFGAALDDESTEIWLDPAYALPEDAPAAQENPAASVSIRVHSCPDDLDASGFYQYGLHCVSERGLYGVPLGLETTQFPVSFLYSQPDGTGQAAPMVWNGVSGRSFTVSEVVSDRPRESVVFCSDRPAGNNPGTLDGTEIPLVGGKMTLPIAAGDQVICEWYRFPGGITAEPDEAEAGAPPTTDGATIAIRTWVCPIEPDGDPDEADDQPSAPGNSNPERDLASLQEACSPSRSSTSFRLTGDDQEHPERQIGGQEANYLGWTGLDAGTYSIEAELVAGSAEPTVFCEGSVPGRRTVRRNLNQLPVTGDAVSYTLTENETLTCEWFNAGGEETEGTGGDGTMNASITVYAWNCPAESDVLFAAGNGECIEPLNGLTFTAAGPDAFQSQTDTGDSIPGAVFFGGVAPGAYTLTAANGYLGDPAVVCDDEVVFAPDGILSVELAAGETLACDWFTTTGEPTDGGAGAGEAEVIDAGTNDQDDDGLLDADETGIYGTDPFNPDSDNDAVGDGDEVTYFLDPLNPDTDGDGLLDGDEIYSYGTDPLNPDTDGDGAADGVEAVAGTDPLNDD